MKAKHLYTAVALSLLFGATLTHAEEYGRIQWKKLPGIDEPIPYPDPALTKGDLSPERLHQVCDKDFRTSSIRADTQAMKCAVFKAYEIACHPCVKSAEVACGQFEIDHYFSLTDGGKDGSETPDDITDNLWPEPGFKTPTFILPSGKLGHWGAGRKDVVENEIHRAICRGELKPENVPAAMADWPNLYLEKKAGEPIDWRRY